MNPGDLVHEAIMRHFAAVAIFVGLPLVGAIIVGLLVSFLQAVTQIQDQTLPQFSKVLIIAIILFAFGNVLTQPLLLASEMVLERFWWVGR